MKRMLSGLAWAAILSTSLTASAREVGGKQIPESTYAPGPVDLVGAGVRVVIPYIMEPYVGAYYRSGQNEAVYMHMRSGLSRSTMNKALLDGFKKSVGKEAMEQQPLAGQIAQIASVLPSSLVEDMVIVFGYEASSKTTVMTIDGEVVVEFKGAEFKSALFGIWMGANPIDKSLKEKMLGE